jgi:hypothetical protein
MHAGFLANSRDLKTNVAKIVIKGGREWGNGVLTGYSYVKVSTEIRFISD